MAGMSLLIERLLFVKLVHDNLHDGIIALPSFPVVLVTVGNNIMVAAAFHFYSFNLHLSWQALSLEIIPMS
jgi:hypothetical protein